MSLPEPYYQNFNGNSGTSTSGSQYGLLSPPLNDSTSHNIQPQTQYVEQSHWMPNHYPTERETSYYAPRQSDQHHHQQLATPLPSPNYLQQSEPQHVDYYAPQAQHNQWQSPPLQQQAELPILAMPQPQKAESETSFELDQEYGSRKPFISKLGYLLRNAEQYADVIQWNSAGDSFILAPSTRFTTEVLPEIFSHSSVSAFTRQLNTYNFKHLNSTQLAENFAYSPDTTTPIKELSAWSHPLFCRDQPTLANRMMPTPSRARAAHQLAKHAMLMEKGTSVKPRAPKVPKEKAPKKRKGQTQQQQEVVEEIVAGDIYRD